MLYFFLLLIPPQTPACVLWMNQPPVPDDWLTVCPVSLMLDWSHYNLRSISPAGNVICEWPAAPNGLTEFPCAFIPIHNYHIEAWLNSNVWACNIWTDKPFITVEAMHAQCPELENKSSLVEVRGPFEIQPPVPAAPACTLPPVNNSVSIATNKDYKFLSGRLSWWNVSIPAWQWQNRWDEQFRGAADAAGVPARLLKAMVGNESQFWPLWTGTAGEVGWMQLTWAGADTALRFEPELFIKYCIRAIWAPYCVSYDTLTDDQRYRVKSDLVAELTVTGTPLQAADQAADDLWTYAHILKAFACQAKIIYPDRDVWQSAAILYNAGTACITGDSICPQGQKYIEEVMK